MFGPGKKDIRSGGVIEISEEQGERQGTTKILKEWLDKCTKEGKKTTRKKEAIDKSPRGRVFFFFSFLGETKMKKKKE